MAQIDSKSETIRNWKAVAFGYQSRLEDHEAQIQRVRAIHAPIDAVAYTSKGQHLRLVCTGCGQDDGNWNTWPCPTIKSLEGS